MNVKLMPYLIMYFFIFVKLVMSEVPLKHFVGVRHEKSTALMLLEKSMAEELPKKEDVCWLKINKQYIYSQKKKRKK